MLNLTPRKLVNYLNKNYGYSVNEITASNILNRCSDELDEVFSEDELINVVEDYLN